MAIKKQTIIYSELPIDINDIDSISIVLRENKFKNISHNNGLVSAQRGSHFATLISPGDPRRWFHKIEVTQNSIKYIIDTWFGVFSPADSQVFTEEAKILSSLMSDNAPDYSQLKKHNRIRLLSDIGLFIGIVSLGFFIGYLLE